MRHRLRRWQQKWPRVYNKIHKTYNVTAEASYNVMYWGVCVTIIYGYLLQRSVRDTTYDVNK